MSCALMEQAPAKVNLALHVLGQRADGYHELDSVVAFLPEVADELELRPADALHLRVAGAMSAGVPVDDDNLILRAARAMIEHWPRHFAPVEVVLHKRLPAAAGIGGGSADAAALMRGMCRLFGFTPPPEELHAVALRLGADVPVCLRSRAARMRGIGERLDALRLPSAALLLVNPGVRVSTAEVFRALQARAPQPERGMPEGAFAALPSNARQLAAWLRPMRNDLQPPACAIAPVISRCLQALQAQPGVLLARMSGSGATCFGIFGTMDEARAAADWFARHHPRFWHAVGNLR